MACDLEWVFFANGQGDSGGLSYWVEDTEDMTDFSRWVLVCSSSIFGLSTKKGEGTLGQIAPAWSSWSTFDDLDRGDPFHGEGQIIFSYCFDWQIEAAVSFSATP